MIEYIIALTLYGNVTNLDLDSRKEQFLDKLDCQTYLTMYDILNSNPIYWKKRFKNAKRWDYIPFNGSKPLIFYKKKDIKRVIELGKDYGIELE